MVAKGGVQIDSGGGWEGIGLMGRFSSLFYIPRDSEGVQEQIHHECQDNLIKQNNTIQYN